MELLRGLNGACQDPSLNTWLIMFTQRIFATAIMTGKQDEMSGYYIKWNLI